MLSQVQFLALMVILFQNGGLLKNSNSNKSRIYQPIEMKLVVHKALPKCSTKFKFQLSRPSCLKMADIYKFQIQIKTEFMNRL